MAPSLRRNPDNGFGQRDKGHDLQGLAQQIALVFHLFHGVAQSQEQGLGPGPGASFGDLEQAVVQTGLAQQNGVGSRITAADRPAFVQGFEKQGGALQSVRFQAGGQQPGPAAHLGGQLRQF